MAEKALFVHISIEVRGGSMPSLFAEKVREALPGITELEDLRSSSMSAMLPITFRLERERMSEPQSYLQISNSAVPEAF